MDDFELQVARILKTATSIEIESDEVTVHYDRSGTHIHFSGRTLREQLRKAYDHALELELDPLFEAELDLE